MILGRSHFSPNISDVDEAFPGLNVDPFIAGEPRKGRLSVLDRLLR